MGEFRVVVQPEAERNIAAVYDWLFERSPKGAARWRQALYHAIERLTHRADQVPVAHESSHFDVTVRDLHFKTRRGRPYRILFTIQEAGVRILFVRAPGQDYIS